MGRGQESSLIKPDCPCSAELIDYLVILCVSDPALGSEMWM